MFDFKDELASSEESLLVSDNDTSSINEYSNEDEEKNIQLNQQIQSNIVDTENNILNHNTNEEMIDQNNPNLARYFITKMVSM